ncbi:hypothetical protein DPMN_044037 [Dreissena polymorpha]|uniref:Uncharacterized protein n=1 Tax=Dreissena polymorpha TaxID=45954 RepID=A0A9D4D3E3_DREPO|nr:hypothetical protein DPMN_044037 [Dreissena polymorpha]
MSVALVGVVCLEVLGVALVGVVCLKVVVALVGVAAIQVVAGTTGDVVCSDVVGCASSLGEPTDTTTALFLVTLVILATVWSTAFRFLVGQTKQ